MLDYPKYCMYHCVVMSVIDFKNAFFKKYKYIMFALL